MRWWCSIFSFSFLSQARKRLRCCGPGPLQAFHVGSSCFEMMTRLTTLMNWWPLIATHTSKPAISYSLQSLNAAWLYSMFLIKQLDVSHFKSHGRAARCCGSSFQSSACDSSAAFHLKRISSKAHLSQSLDIAQQSYPRDQTHPYLVTSDKKNKTKNLSALN